MRCRFFAIYFLCLGFFFPSAHAAVYKLADGQTLSGEPVSYNETGLIVRLSDGSFSARTPWNDFTQESLKKLLAEARTAKDKSFLEPLIEENIEQQSRQKEIVIKKVTPPARPAGSVGILAGFSSPLFVLIFLLIYAANIYAAYEIAFFKNLPPGKVCALAAIVPWIGPAVFLALPGKADPMHGELYEKADGQPVEEKIIEATLVEASPAPVAFLPGAPTAARPAPIHSSLKLEATASAPVLEAVVMPEPIFFRRGEFSFNRRFFETKLAGFFRIVPAEAEKDLVIVLKSARGDFIGKRITRVTQTELYLQVIKDGVSHDEMIPFNEVQEVIVRHKDAT